MQIAQDQRHPMERHLGGCSTHASLAEKVTALRDPATYSQSFQAIDTVETHFSWVFLTPTLAYKLKKPVRLQGMDFRSLPARLYNCREELRLNRRLAASVYLDLVPLVRGVDGLRLGGSGEVVDWLVKMRRLPRERMLDSLIRNRELQASDVERLAQRLLAFYHRCSPIPIDGARYRARLRREIDISLGELCEPCHRLDAAAATRIGAALKAFLNDAAAMFDARAAGHIVEGHGDLRPEHVYAGDPPLIIDCLEFSRQLRQLDPIDELCFLGLECERLGAGAIQDILLRCYADATGEIPPPALVAFYRSYRALLRGRLAAQHLRDPDCRRTQHWWQTAQGYLALAGRNLPASESVGQQVREGVSVV